MTDQTPKTESQTAQTSATSAAPAPKAETTTKVEAKIAAKPSAAKPATRAKARRKPAARKAAAKTVAKSTGRRAPARKAAAQRATAKTISAKPVTAKPVSKRAAKAVRAIKTQGAKTMTKTIDTGLFAADQLKSVFGDVNQRAKFTTERSAKMVEEMADLSRGNVEALVASSKVAAKGVERLSQDAAEYSRKSFEEASAALRNVASIKSPTDLFRLQGDYARAAFDSVVAESARFSETLLKIAGDVAEPMTSRYTVAAERAKTLAA